MLNMVRVNKTKELEKRLKMEYVPEEYFDEGTSPKQIKMAIGIASDPRYRGGNYTGDTMQLKRLKKDLHHIHKSLLF